MDITQVGPWELETKLGSGGMGTVYLGKHKETGKVAAIKVLPPSLAREPGFIERFKREIASIEQLKSPHIVEFFESGNDGETYFYSMEYVDGETLTQRLKRDKRIPWPEVIDLSLQICRALKAAHNCGIIHRDLKPSNLMISKDGTMKLTDFGVAQVFASQKLTITGGIVGTAEYMSPEQAKGQRATKKSDLYSLGAVMYVMLTGRPPFSGKTSLDVIHKHQFARFDRPALIATDIPPQLDEIVCKLLEKDPDKRFPDAYVLSLRLAEVQKRFAWQAAQRVAPHSNSAAANSYKEAVESTEPGQGARKEDGLPLAPTVLIPEAFGQHVPLGATVATPAAVGSPAQLPQLAATITADSARRSDSDSTRQLAGPSQGPGTIMRNLMRKAISEQQAGSVISRVFDNTWVQVTALVLLIAVCGYLYLSREPSPEERFRLATAIMQRPESTEWMVAKEHFEMLKREDPARWQEQVDPHLRAIAVYETKLKFRTNRPKGPAPNSEPERLLELATRYLNLGDIALAERKLEALLALTAGVRELKQTHDQALDLLEFIRRNRVVRETDGWLSAALKRADDFEQTNQPAEAREIWSAVIELYADDPSAAAHVATARRKLQTLGTPSRDLSDATKTSENHSSTETDHP
jgi:serine/threonine-protein kinase